ncbi:MAG: response regulator [Saprospiraceae bacterium]|nr:response regulator [Saprospiraceae bacterium]
MTKTKHKRLIFIVDDDPIYQTIIKNILFNQGYSNVVTHSSGQECLDKINDTPWFVFLDYDMDGLNGIEVLKKIKQINPNINVVMVSSREKVDIALTALNLGALDYVIKDNMLFSQINKLIERIAFSNQEYYIPSA